MPLRMMPPVASPVAASALTAAAVAAGGGDGAASVSELGAALRAHYMAQAVALTDSGTSALVLALGISAKPGGTVALPAYGCVDLVAAAAQAGLRVRLYDVEPSTLAPDLDSVRQALGRGADVLVVAHLYGFPVNLADFRTMAAAAGTRVIDDAAQHAGGLLDGRPAGAEGPLTVLSFGRGKGVSGGRGGALLATARADAPTVASLEGWVADARDAPAGWGDLSLAAAQWVFGRPALYALPASIPALGVGETVYRAAHVPRRLSRAAAALVYRGLAHLAADREARSRNAAWYAEHLSSVPGLRMVSSGRRATPGYLRFPVLDALGRAVAPALGVVRSYPRPLGAEPSIVPLLHSGEGDTPGAREICDALFTLPTHAMVRDADRARVVAWAWGRVPGESSQPDLAVGGAR